MNNSRRINSLQPSVGLDGRLELGLRGERGFEVVIGSVSLNEEVGRVQAVCIEQGLLRRVCHLGLGYASQQMGTHVMRLWRRAIIKRKRDKTQCS